MQFGEDVYGRVTAEVFDSLIDNAE
jgi:hypothetical protein